ncbi:unnamed protein product [Amoebophrya sp. A25]|nr:unnamed protein product [Amoebophrya sp. A25]|eukprot:GSA25T00003143001.1
MEEALAQDAEESSTRSTLVEMEQILRNEKANTQKMEFVLHSAITSKSEDLDEAKSSAEQLQEAARQGKFADALRASLCSSPSLGVCSNSTDLSARQMSVDDYITTETTTRTMIVAANSSRMADDFNGTLAGSIDEEEEVEAASVLSVSPAIAFASGCLAGLIAGVIILGPC